MSDQRVTSGVEGLDPLLDGGFPANRSVLVCGEIGTGKTTLATQFLIEGIAHGEPGVLVAVDAKPRHVLEDAARFGWDLQAAADRKMLAILDASPYFTVSRSRTGGLDPRQVASDLTQQVRRTRAKRLVIDSITSLVPPDAPASEVHDFLRSLFFSLEDSLQCTVLLTSWAGARQTNPLVASYAEFLASGVLDLKLASQGDRFRRTLFVRKMRGTPTDLTVHGFDIEPGRGLVLDGAVAAKGSRARGGNPDEQKVASESGDEARAAGGPGLRGAPRRLADASDRRAAKP